MATRKQKNNFKDLLPGIERLILTSGMMITFAAVSFRLAESGKTDQLLPCLTGLMGLILGYYYGKRTKQDDEMSDSIKTIQ